MSVAVSRVSICCLVFLAGLSACSTTRRTATAPARAAADLHTWQANGRIAVSGSTAGGSGSFTWVQQDARAKVQLRGPIGIGNLQLTLSADELRVATADGQEFVADAAEAELEMRLGASVPAQDLRYWMVGIAAPGEHKWSTSGEASTLLQHGWQIDYERFAVTDGTRLPTKLIAASGPAKVRVIIDRWTLK